jgi:DNA polymerase III psi subunit
MRMIGTRGAIIKNHQSQKKTQAVHNFVQETKPSHLSSFLKRQNTSFIQQINITEISTLCNHSQRNFWTFSKSNLSLCEEGDQIAAAYSR